MKTVKIEVEYKAFGSIDELNEADVNLVKKARAAAENAWAPYSHFQVGAAVLLDNGEVIMGNNQENAAYPSGLCAERVALFAANANYPDSKVITLAISANSSGKLVTQVVKPCGSCRQAILETETRFAEPIRLILDGAEEIYIVEGIKNLLPLSFDKSDLKRK